MKKIINEVSEGEYTGLRIRNLVCDMCEVFDDFLNERGIEIPSSVQEMKENSTSPEECGSTIYGMDWAEIEDGVADILMRYLNRHGIECENEWEN